MERFIRHYDVTNGVMDSEFRLSPYGMAQLSQDCFASFVSRFHIAAFDFRHNGLMWIISEFSMRMTGERPFWGEDIEVELWLSEPPRIKAMFDYRILYKGREVMSGNCAWAILDAQTRKPANAAEIMKDVPVAEGQALGYRRFVIPASGEKLLDYSHVANRSDTDFNYHVTNLAYMNVCLDSMPDHYSRSHTLRFFSIRFLQEAFLDDTLTCSVYKADAQEMAEGMEGWNYVISSAPGKINIRAHAQFSDMVEQTADENMDLRIRKL